MSEDTVEDQGEGPVGITDHELVALVDMGTTDAGRRSLDAVGILPMLEDEPSLRAGYATLLVRDLAGLDKEMIVAQHFANAVAAIMGEAEDVVRLVVTKDGESVARTVFISAAEGGFLLDMTMFGVHAAQPLAPGQNILDLIFEVVSGMAENEAVSLPFTVELARYTAAGTRSVALTTGERGWSMKAGAGAPVSGPPQTVWATARTLLG